MQLFITDDKDRVASDLQRFENGQELKTVSTPLKKRILAQEVKLKVTE